MKPFRERLFADHSPALLLAVCVGYWMPLDWMLRGSAKLGNLTAWEILSVVSGSAVLNFGLFALMAIAAIYLVAGVARLFSFSFRASVRMGVAAGGNIIFLFVSIRALKIALFPNKESPFAVTVVVAALLIAIGIGLAIRRVSIAAKLVIAHWITAGALPISIVVIGIGLLGHARGIRIDPDRRAGVERPNIILITLDALSASHLSCYGYGRKTSPEIDAFAGQSVFFERFYANANWTRPGVASFLNGTRPWLHSGDLGRPKSSVTAEQNLLGCLARAGYDVRSIVTHSFASNYWQGTNFAGTQQELIEAGSELPTDEIGLILPSAYLACTVGPIADVRDILSHIWQSRMSPGDRTSIPLRHAIAMLSRVPRDRPWFFWLHLYCPHDPYAAPEGFVGRFDKSPRAMTAAESWATPHFKARGDPHLQAILEARYDEFILATDHTVGLLFKWLRDNQQFDQTCIVISADHGESFRHGYGLHGGPLLTDDIIRVPCLIKLPDSHLQTRVPELYEQADLAPTILKIAGVAIPRAVEGVPYPSRTPNAPVFSMNRDLETNDHTFSVAMIDDRWKFVGHYGKWIFDWPRRELYDLREDPGEMANLVETRPDITTPMERCILRELEKRQLNPDTP